MNYICHYSSCDRRVRSRAPKFSPGIVAANIDAAVRVLQDLNYHGPVTLSYDDTELEKALSVYEDSNGSLQVVGGANGPITVNRDDDLDVVFSNPNIIKASKVCTQLSPVNHS